MSLVTRLMVLVEYRLVRLLIAAVPLIGLLAALWWPQDARARASASHKIVANLRDALQSPDAIRASEARDTPRGRCARAFVLGIPCDPEPAEARG